MERKNNPFQYHEKWSVTITRFDKMSYDYQNNEQSLVII